MTPIPQYQFKIGSGYNLPLGSLTNVELLKPTGDKYFYPPIALYDPGQFIIRGDGQLSIAGYPSVQWAWTGNPGGRVTRAQARLLMDNYCGGSYSGTVTVYTQTDNNGAYTIANAILNLPKLPEAGKNFGIFQNYTAQLARFGVTG